MGKFTDYLHKRNPNLFPQHTYTEREIINPPPRPPSPTPAETPAQAQRIADTLNPFLEIIEKTTGLSRREIFLQLLKTGFKGGNILDIITGLSGKQPPAEAKFVRYVKTLAIWVPVAVFLMGLSLVAVVVFAKLIIALTGGIL